MSLSLPFLTDHCRWVGKTWLLHTPLWQSVPCMQPRLTAHGLQLPPRNLDRSRCRSARRRAARAGTAVGAVAVLQSAAVLTALSGARRGRTLRRSRTSDSPWCAGVQAMRQVFSPRQRPRRKARRRARRQQHPSRHRADSHDAPQSASFNSNMCLLDTRVVRNTPAFNPPPGNKR